MRSKPVISWIVLGTLSFGMNVAGCGDEETSADAAPSSGDCPARYAVAALATLEMRWPESVGFLGGTGKLYAWTKSVRRQTADGVTTQEQPCGVSLPVVTTTPLLDGLQISNDIPGDAFDMPSMPRFKGRVIEQDGMFVFELGASVLGASLDDPEGPWPARAAIMAVDHDGDGNPGMTAIPRTGDGFALPPTDIGQTQHADAVYIASRLALRLTAADPGCTGETDGMVEPLGFNFTVLGCHAKDRGACQESEVNLIDNNSPTFEFGSESTWTSVPIAETASCADVRDALPAE